jgi:hypothetical protein
MHFRFVLMVCMLLVIYPLEASELWMNFGAEAIATFVPGPVPKYHKTFTGVSSCEVGEGCEGEEHPIWWLTEDNTTPCLEGPPGCLLGTFTFQLPRVELPAGTEVRHFEVYWSGHIDVLHYFGSRTTNFIYFDIRSPSGSYTTGGISESGSTERFVWGQHLDEEWMRSALFSTGQLPATVVDVRFHTSGPKWWYPNPGLGEVRHYDVVYSPIEAEGQIYLDLECKFPPVPEPSTGVLLVLGMGLMALTRRRTVH